MNETQAIEIIQNVLLIDGPYTTERIAGGLSGSLLIKVQALNKAVAVRFWNKQWAEDFPQDLACQIIASDAGYGPVVYYADEVNHITVMEFLAPEPFPKLHIRLKTLVDLVKKIHNGPVVPHGINKSQDLDEAIADVKKLKNIFLDLDALKSVKEAVFAVMASNARYVPCHRDLHPGNLIYAHDRFYAIDYTWGSMDDSYIDLATIAVFNCESFEEEKLLLRLYFEREPYDVEIARLSLMKQLTKIFYGLEFLRVIPRNTMSNVSSSKNYLDFGCHGSVTNPYNLYEYAVSMLSEVVDYSHSVEYSENITLLSYSWS